MRLNRVPDPGHLFMGGNGVEKGPGCPFSGAAVRFVALFWQRGLGISCSRPHFVFQYVGKQGLAAPVRQTDAFAGR